MAEGALWHMAWRGEKEAGRDGISNRKAEHLRLERPES